MRRKTTPSIVALALVIACSEVTGATNCNLFRGISGSSAFALSSRKNQSPRVVSKADTKNDTMADSAAQQQHEEKTHCATENSKQKLAERSISWNSKSFSQLSTGELYELLRLRAEIFVVEQNCAYQDLDNNDHDAIHLYGTINGQIVAYVRILPAGVCYDSPAIGR